MDTRMYSGGAEGSHRTDRRCGRPADYFTRVTENAHSFCKPANSRRYLWDNLDHFTLTMKLHNSDLI